MLVLACTSVKFHELNATPCQSLAEARQRGNAAVVIRGVWGEILDVHQKVTCRRPKPKMSFYLGVSEI